jgi:hypothetical protein
MADESCEPVTVLRQCSQRLHLMKLLRSTGTSTSTAQYCFSSYYCITYSICCSSMGRFCCVYDDIKRKIDSRRPSYVLADRLVTGMSAINDGHVAFKSDTTQQHSFVTSSQWRTSQSVGDLFSFQRTLVTAHSSVHSTVCSSQLA